MQLQIAPSLLAADFLHLEKDVQMLNAHADLIHLDVMDGTLVPNLSFGFSVMEPLSKIATVPLDTHLMIVHPDQYFKRFAALGLKMLSFHLEAAIFLLCEDRLPITLAIFYSECKWHSHGYDFLIVDHFDLQWSRRIQSSNAHTLIGNWAI